jgi:16S rRNA (guanine1207-N2)-methyltransferase
MSEHYFAADPSSPFTRVPVDAQVWDHRLHLVSASGVFSTGRVDPGTAVLFRSTRPPATGTTYLDLGCGYGLITCALAVARPEATVWAVDVNERALRLTAENADRVGAGERVRVGTPDDVPDDVVLDQIWSNPPIRIGKPALHALLLRWLPRLAPDGVAHLVVGKNLGADSLQRWLRDQGYGCDRMASAKGFRVLAVHPAR